MVQEYISSNKFIQDCGTIDSRDGIEIGILFRYVSKIYIDYFLFTKTNKNN